MAVDLAGESLDWATICWAVSVSNRNADGTESPHCMLPQSRGPSQNVGGAEFCLMRAPIDES